MKAFVADRAGAAGRAVDPLHVERGLDRLDVDIGEGVAQGRAQLDADRPGKRGDHPGDRGPARRGVDLHPGQMDVVDHPGGVAVEHQGRGVGRAQLDRDLVDRAVAVIDPGRTGRPADAVGAQGLGRATAVAALNAQDHGLVDVDEVDHPAVGVVLAGGGTAAEEAQMLEPHLVAEGADAAGRHLDGQIAHRRAAPVGRGRSVDEIGPGVLLQDEGHGATGVDHRRPATRAHDPRPWRDVHRRRSTGRCRPAPRRSPAR